MVRNIIFIIFITIITVIAFTASPAYAQFNIANIYDISDPDVKEGDILIFDPKAGLQRTNHPYDSHIFGVYEEHPGLVFRRTDGAGKPVVRLGIAKVNVSLSNGPIKKGDLITSSTISGLGMKASSPGYVVGIALSDSKENAKFTSFCKKTPESCPKDQINVALDISFKDAASTTAYLKNMLAALIILISIIFALFIISRVMPKAIEAIGRNPLAKRSIEFAMLLVIITVIAIVVGAIVGAILILRLSTI